MVGEDTGRSGLGRIFGNAWESIFKRIMNDIGISRSPIPDAQIFYGRAVRAGGKNLCGALVDNGSGFGNSRALKPGEGSVHRAAVCSSLRWT